LHRATAKQDADVVKRDTTAVQLGYDNVNNSVFRGAGSVEIDGENCRVRSTKQCRNPLMDTRISWADK